jgi:hypothetical protein
MEVLTLKELIRQISQSLVDNPDKVEVIYYDGDPIDENGLFFADGTRASEEDLYYIYYWPRELG